MSTEQRRVEPEAWASAAAQARDEGLTWFAWLDAVDDIDRADTISVTLRVANPASAQAVELTSTVPRDGGHLPSLRALWPAAGWAERAVAEGFGVAFDDGDPRPLLFHPDSGAPEFPLRKDRLLPRRQEPWPGAKEDPTQARSRRRLVPPGVPDPQAATPAEIVASAYGTGRAGRGRR